MFYNSFVYTYTFFISQPESIHTDRAVVDKMIGWPILDLFALFHPAMNVMNVFEKAKKIIAKTWGDATTIDERKAALTEKMNHKNVSLTIFVVAHVILVYR